MLDNESAITPDTDRIGQLEQPVWIQTLSITFISASRDKLSTY
jgi:hypothetical protein